MLLCLTSKLKSSAASVYVPDLAPACSFPPDSHLLRLAVQVPYNECHCAECYAVRTLGVHAYAELC